MVKRIVSILILIAVIMGCCGCQKDLRDKIVFPKDELLSGYTFETNLEMETVKESDGMISVHFHRGEMVIYGQIFIPEGEGPFPAVIISGGLFTTHYLYQGAARTFAENGIVSVIYDPTCMGEGAESDGDLLDFSPLTQASDIEAIVSAVAELPYVNGNDIFLWGHSMGGLASGYVGFNNPELIRGMILVEPAFHMNGEARELSPDADGIPDEVTTPIRIGGAYYRDLLKFDIYDNMSDYKRNVIIYAGTMSPSIGSDQPEVLTRADELLPSSELIFVEGTNHGFQGSPMTRVIEESVAFILENMKT